MEDTGFVADEIEGIPHPAKNFWLVGHEKTRSRILQHYRSGNMHHAWLVTGPRGIGKATLMLRIAAHILRYPDPSTAPEQLDAYADGDPVEGKIAARAHPNLLHLARPWDSKAKKFKTRLTVDEIRSANRFFGDSRGEEGWRIAIIDAVDDMNASASNALLKILEEPPQRTVFFVLSHSPALVSATIRSRCLHIPVKQLPDEDVLAVLDRFGILKSVEENDRALLAELSKGSVRQGIVLAKGDGLDLYKRFVDASSNLACADWTKIHALADRVSLRGREDNFRLLLNIAMEYMEANATGKTGQEEDISVLARWAEVWEKTRQSVALAEGYNLDKKQVIINLFQNMGEAANS